MKHFATNFLMKACYYLGVDSFFYYLNRRAKRVVTFHNVMPEEREAFRSIVKELSKKFCISTDVDDASTLTITFDDGYSNQYEIAAEVLKEEGDIPAILFVSGKLIDLTEIFGALSVDLIVFWCTNVPKEILDKEFGSGNRRYVLLNIIFPRYRNDAKARGSSVVNELNGVYPFVRIFGRFDDEWLRLRFTGITKDQLEKLRQRGWTVGWHTQNHFPLGFLSDEDVGMEMTAPTDFCSLPMSYPYGTQKDVGKIARHCAKEFRFKCAFSNVVCPGEDDYFRCRFAQLDNRYRVHFELSGVKYFLKHFKLLPRR